MYPREYGVIYRGPGFLALASYLSFSVFLRVAGRAYLPERGGGEDEEPNHTTPSSLVLYKTFNTL